MSAWNGLNKLLTSKKVHVDALVFDRSSVDRIPCLGLVDIIDTTFNPSTPNPRIRSSKHKQYIV